MTKHTPASWVCEGITQDGDFAIYNEKTFEEVLDIHTGTVHEKNLHLILAAPDMFEVLQMMADKDFEFSDYECLLARMALAKARGEK